MGYLLLLGYYEEEAVADPTNGKASSSQNLASEIEQVPHRGRLGEDDAASALLSVRSKGS